MGKQTESSKYSPDTLETAITYLKQSEKSHFQILKDIFKCDGQAIYGADVLLYGVAQRSIKLTSGFIAMVVQSNAECAVPLLRLQLDNVMRFNALWLVKDPNDVLLALLRDEFSKLKSRDGKPLKDYYLCEQISKEHEWFKKVYNKTSGYIHLSSPGMFSSVVDVGNHESRTISWKVGSEAGRNWRTEEKKEAVDAFIAATEILFNLFYSWGYTKETMAKQRKSKAGKKQFQKK